MLPDTNKTLFNFTLKDFFVLFCFVSKALVAFRQECSRQTANTSTFLSMCIPHVVPSQFLVMPITPINVHTCINSLLANYLSAGVSVSKTWKWRKGEIRFAFPPYFLMGCIPENFPILWTHLVIWFFHTVKEN